jgi:hypothetical protein
MISSRWSPNETVASRERRFEDDIFPVVAKRNRRIARAAIRRADAILGAVPQCFVSFGGGSNAMLSRPPRRLLQAHPTPWAVCRSSWSDRHRSLIFEKAQELTP